MNNPNIIYIPPPDPNIVYDLNIFEIVDITLSDQQTTNECKSLNQMTYKDKIVDNRIIIDVKISNQIINKEITYNALIDTGAQLTFISEKIINELELTHVSMKINVNMINSQESSYLFPCTLKFQNSTNQIPLCCPVFSHDNYDIIIGMDIIQKGKLIVENDQFEFSI